MSEMNVLWIMADQFRADCMGCMGDAVIQTPHLDALAAKGVVFDNAFCQSPVCMASRAALLTGRSPVAVGVRGMGILPPWETTFPEVLQCNGYHTGAFGKLHLTPEQYTRAQLESDVPILDWRRYQAHAALPDMQLPAIKKNYGFIEHVGCDDALQGLHHQWLREQGHEVGRRSSLFPDTPGAHDVWVSPYPSELHQTTFIAQQAAASIRRQQGGGPWMSFCSFVAPHHPFEAPADQIARYDDADIPAPAYKGGVSLDPMPPVLAGAVDEAARMPEHVMRTVTKHYYASISLIDDAVGMLLDTLDKTGQADNTIVMFVADHGEFCGNHGLLRKPSFHYDETLRVPLIMHAPGIAGGSAGKRVDGQVELIDLHPTLLGMLGIDRNAGVQGVDWSTALREGATGTIGHEQIYSDMFDQRPLVCGTPGGPYTAVLTLRTRDWKLNLYPTTAVRCGQLFNLREDPDESVNRFADPACRDIVDALTHAIIQRQHRDADTLPLRLTQW